MACKSISVFLLTLVNVLVITAMILPQQRNDPVFNFDLIIPCSSYYGLFFMDNTDTGNKLLNEQLLLAGYYFTYGNLSNYFPSATLVSQSTTSLTNNFSVAFPNDFLSFNQQSYEILKQTPGGTQLSYANLVFEAFGLNFNDKSTYSLNPFLVFFIDSKLQDLPLTENFISKFKEKYNIKSLAIVLDSQYLNDATQLVGESQNAFLYNLTDINRASKANDWILQQTCSVQGLPVPTLSPACDSYINIVLVATSEGLSNNQFNQQINLIENYILPLWKNFSKFSFSVVFNDVYAEVLPYKVFTNISDVKRYIDSISLSNSQFTPLYLPMIRYTTDFIYQQVQNKMTTFIFLPYINIFEISAASFYTTLLSLKSNLNIITLGQNLKPFSAELLRPTNIINWDFSNDTIPSIQKFVSTTIKCN